MIKWIVFSALLLTATPYVLARTVWLSSNTATAENGTLCGGGKRGIYHAICVNTTVASSTATVYNSSFTTVGVQSYGVKNTNASGCFYYDVVAPKGLYYGKFGTGDVTFLYDCY